MKNKSKINNYEELRHKAERLLDNHEKEVSQDLSDEIKILLHELNVHQVELEMQNEELQETQGKLELSRAKYQELFDFAPVAYFSVDENGRIKTANFTACSLLGIERKYLLNQLLFRFIDREYLAKFNDLVKKTFESELKHTLEVKILGKKSEELFVYIESIAIAGEGGRQCLIAMTDMTGKKNAESELRRLNDELENRVQERTRELSDINIKLKMEIHEREKTEDRLKKILEELQRSNKDLEEFAYVVSHDLQEPLRMIASFTSLLADRIGETKDNDTKEFMEFIVDGALRMQQLIQGILNLSRITTRALEFTPIDTNQVLQNAIKNLRSTIENEDAKVTYDPLPDIVADPIQIEHVFQNLIGNSLKYRSEDKPIIHISSKENDYEWIFSVQDNGIGIDPEFHDRIFKIFQRLHLRNEYPGIGIGLSLCLKIIQRHKGKIWVESEKGKGATFYFSIPKNL